MEQNNYDALLMPKKPSSMLNVLTLLSLIGSGIGFIGAIWNFINADKAFYEMKKMKDTPEMEDAPSFVKAFVNDDAVKMAEAMMENKLPIMLITMMGCALCFVGALYMRKLKKQGYFIWMAGEILPLISSLIFVGLTVYSGMGFIGLLFPIAMIIMYTVCRKELSEA
jgi:hypothetical protein